VRGWRYLQFGLVVFLSAGKDELTFWGLETSIARAALKATRRRTKMRPAATKLQGSETYRHYEDTELVSITACALQLRCAAFVRRSSNTRVGKPHEQGQASFGEDGWCRDIEAQGIQKAFGGRQIVSGTRVIAKWCKCKSVGRSLSCLVSVVPAR
jgi:hypothetical protein